MDEPRQKRKYEKLTPEVLKRRQEERELLNGPKKPKGRPATGRKEKYENKITWDQIKDADREEVKAVRTRFDKCYEFLRENYGKEGIAGIKSDYDFCKVNLIRSSTFNIFKQRKHVSPTIYFMIVLIEKHKVNAEWLLTGKGKMMKP